MKWRERFRKHTDEMAAAHLAGEDYVVTVEVPELDVDHWQDYADGGWAVLQNADRVVLVDGKGGERVVKDRYGNLT